MRVEFVPWRWSCARRGPSSAAISSQRRAGLHDPAAGDDRHVRAEVGDVFDDVRREDHDHVLADLGQQVEEAVALLGVEAGGRLVDDDQLRLADAAPARCRSAGACRRRSRPAPSCARPTGSPAAAALRRFRGARRASAMPFSTARWSSMSQRRHARVDAEVLRQVAERAAQRVRARAARRCRRSGSRRGSASAAWRCSASATTCRHRSGPSRPNMPRGICQRDAVERARAVGVDVGQVVDAKHGGSLSDRVWAGLLNEGILLEFWCLVNYTTRQ